MLGLYPDQDRRTIWPFTIGGALWVFGLALHCEVIAGSAFFPIIPNSLLRPCYATLL